MKCFWFLPLFVTSLASAQLVEKTRSELNDVQTVEQAKAYLSAAGETTGGEVFTLSSTEDTTDVDRVFIALEPGKVVEFESNDKKSHYFYKSLASAPITSWSVQYIYLDGGKLSRGKIDSLRTTIFSRLKQGEPFEQLAQHYSMDGNAKNGGNLGWFSIGITSSKIHISREQISRRHCYMSR